MTTTQIIGALILTSPFVALAVLTVRELGVRETFIIFGGIIGLAILMGIGSYLLVGAS